MFYILENVSVLQFWQTGGESQVFDLCGHSPGGWTSLELPGSEVKHVCESTEQSSRPPFNSTMWRTRTWVTENLHCRHKWKHLLKVTSTQYFYYEVTVVRLQETVGLSRNKSLQKISNDLMRLASCTRSERQNICLHFWYVGKIGHPSWRLERNCHSERHRFTGY